MYMLAINHAVADFDKWKAVYDTFPPTTDGAAFARVNKSVDDGNNVTVVAGFTSMETLKAFIDDPELKARMMEAGVAGAPRIEIFEEVDVIQA